MDANWVIAFASVVYTIGTFLLWWTTRSSVEVANRSANAALVSSQITQAGFENVTKQHKARAYWTLYRIHYIINVGPQDRAWIKSVDLAPIQDFLHIHGHTLHAQDRENIRLVLSKMEAINALTAVKADVTHYDRVRPCVRDAANALREDWMELL